VKGTETRERAQQNGEMFLMIINLKEKYLEIKTTTKGKRNEINLIWHMYDFFTFPLRLFRISNNK
jgi:hypothetical protein